MAVGVGAGADGGVAGGGHGVGVLVVAVGEVGATLEEEIEAGGRLEIVAIAVEEVTAELIDDEFDDQLGGVAVGIGMSGGGGCPQSEGEQGGGQLSHRDRVHGGCGLLPVDRGDARMFNRCLILAMCGRTWPW